MNLNQETALMPRMSVTEVLSRKADIQRQARDFFSCEENVFPGEPEADRWRKCVAIVAEIWFWLGPQKDPELNAPAEARGTDPRSLQPDVRQGDQR